MAETFGKMMKRAFTWHWNLLGLGAGVAVAVFSGQPDVVLPIVIAAELAFMGFVGSTQRFQNILIGKEMLDDKPPPLPFEAKLDRLLSQLSDAEITRFQQLRNRIRNLILLRRRVKAADPEFAGSATFRIESLDKLLWLFLKLLHQRHALQQFTDTTDRFELAESAKSTEEELALARESSSNPRLLRSLEEKLDTIQQRMSNYDESEENLQIVNIELDKTEQKINHICELGMTNTDGVDLSAKIEALTNSLESSERTLHDLVISSPFEEEQGPRPVLLDLGEIDTIERVEFE